MPIQNKISEEDIRTQIIYPWLRNQGFDVSKLQIETTFELRIGRGLFRVGSDTPLSRDLRPRADILVKTQDDRNLFIFEIKAPDEPLDDDVIEQAISYARLLRNGGIAPFVVLANGREVRLYNSITGEAIDENQLVRHPYVIQGIPISVDSEDLRLEALEKFVSLSPNNLLAFCRNQVEYRMSLLKDDDPYSDKKYIPSLYIDRQDPRDKINKYLEAGNSTILITGGPQMGKTCFTCNTVDRLLANDEPCLFYPAISMRNGLLTEIQDDFGWILGSHDPTILIARKLNRVLDRLGKTLTIIVDGWNEADSRLAHTISEECRRIHSSSIRFIISLTNITARRLLIDAGGNIGFIAETSSIRQKSAVELLEVSPELSTGNIINITPYTEEEVSVVYARYCDVYEVSIPENHVKITDPFLLRLGMQGFARSHLPMSLDEPELIKQSIDRKCGRVQGFSTASVKVQLEKIAQIVLRTDGPAPFSEVIATLGILDLPQSIFEAALLSISRTSGELPEVDFYYERERDYIVAYWLNKWHQNHPNLQEKLSPIYDNRINLNAFSWFIQQEVHQPLFKKILNLLLSFDNSNQLFSNCNSSFQIVTLRALRRQLKQNIGLAENSLEQILDIGFNSSDVLVIAETTKLLIEGGFVEEDFKARFREDTHWLEAMLSIDDEYPFEDQDSLSRVILEALKDIHLEENWVYDEHHDVSEVSDLLLTIAKKGSNASSGAIKASAYIAPLSFFEKLDDIYNLDLLDDIFVAAELGAESLEQHYFGGMEMLFCEGPSPIEALAETPALFLSEYRRVNKINWVMNKYFPRLTSGTKILREFQRVMIRFKEYRSLLVSDMIIDLSRAFDPKKREIAAEFLGEMHIHDAVPTLIEALNDQSWFVEKAAADALFKIGTREADKAYEAWLKKISSKDQRRPEFGAPINTEID